MCLFMGVTGFVSPVSYHYAKYGEECHGPLGEVITAGINYCGPYRLFIMTRIDWELYVCYWESLCTDFYVWQSCWVTGVCVRRHSIALKFRGALFVWIGNNGSFMETIFAEQKMRCELNFCSNLRKQQTLCALKIWHHMNRLSCTYQ